MAVSVTSKGQVTIPKRVRDALGITPGSKVEFDVAGGGARLKLVKRHASSRIEDGAAILNYKGPSHSSGPDARWVGDEEGSEACAPLTRTSLHASTSTTMLRRDVWLLACSRPATCSFPRL